MTRQEQIDWMLSSKRELEAKIALIELELWRLQKVDYPPCIF
jgi:hypothetical protein